VTENPPAYAGEDFELHGSITRNLLLKMLLHRISFVPKSGERSERDEQLFSNPVERDELLEQLKQIPFKAPSASDVASRLADEDVQNMSLDVRSFMQRHPFVVHGDARLSRAYRQFRTMGLRHMYVMPQRPRVVGLLTRKDVIQERASLTLGLYARGLLHPRVRSVSRSFDPPMDDIHRRATSMDAPRGGSADTAAALSQAERRLSDAAEAEERESLPYIPYYSNNADGEIDPSSSSNPFTQQQQQPAGRNVPSSSSPRGGRASDLNRRATPR
jgi:chloride channel 7